MAIDNQYVSFDIIKRNGNGLIYKRAGLLLLLSILVITFIPANYLGSTTSSILFLAIILLFIGVGIKSYGIKEYDEIGKIILSAESIQISENNSVTEILIEQVEVIAFHFSGYKNQPVFGRTGSSKDGLNNFITLRNQAYERRFELLITNQYKVNILNRLLDHYEQLGIKNSFEDSYSKDAKKNLVLKLLSAFGHSQ